MDLWEEMYIWEGRDCLMGGCSGIIEFADKEEGIFLNQLLTSGNAHYQGVCSECGTEYTLNAKIDYHFSD